MSQQRRKHAIIYIPGLGDRQVVGQRLAISTWRRLSVEPMLFQMKWADGESFASKLDSLLTLIDRLTREGKLVSLVGSSAGGSAVINAYAERRQHIHGVVCICGKLRNKDNIWSGTYRQNPAFEQSMIMLADSTPQLTTKDRQRILSLHPTSDQSVPVADTKLPGVASKGMPVAGHVSGIAYGLTIGSFGVIRFLRNLPPR